MAKTNRQLEADLAALTERVDKLDGKRKPKPPAKDAPKDKPDDKKTS